MDRNFTFSDRLPRPGIEAVHRRTRVLHAYVRVHPRSISFFLFEVRIETDEQKKGGRLDSITRRIRLRRFAFIRGNPGSQSPSCFFIFASVVAPT